MKKHTIPRRPASWSNQSPPFRYFKLFKPYNVLCQFTDGQGRGTLKDCFPVEGLYPVGRLDRDSEGLVLLTDDGPLAHRLTDPRFGHPRTYFAQVERVPTLEVLMNLRRGVVLGDGPTRPVDAELAPEPSGLPARPVPIRFRKSVPTAWLRLVLREGRNRQVRRMTASVGHPTLRLVRTAIGSVGLDDLVPGEFRELARDEVDALRAGVEPGAR